MTEQAMGHSVPGESCQLVQLYCAVVTLLQFREPCLISVGHLSATCLFYSILYYPA